MEIMGKIRLVLLARSLESGGTERQLVTLARTLDKSIFDVVVCLFYETGELLEDLKDQEGVRVYSLKKGGKLDVPGFLGRFISFLSREKPHVLYAMLPVPNLVGLLGARLGCRAKVIWGVRASRKELPRGNPLPGIAYGAEAKCARFSDLVIANSHAGKDNVVLRGFPANKMQVIHNGIDTHRFSFDPAARDSLRKNWGVKPEHKVVGLVANVRPLKDYPTFLKAASLLAAKDKLWRFVCIGNGVTEELREQARSLGLDKHLIWAGLCQDMPGAYSALDLLCSTSLAEGFSNVIAEAMSCGRPCVVTDVGDSAIIVGDCGSVVPVENPEKLALAVNELMDNVANHPDLCQKNMLRIKEYFDTSLLAEKTTQSILDLLGRPTPQHERK